MISEMGLVFNKDFFQVPTASTPDVPTDTVSLDLPTEGEPGVRKIVISFQPEDSDQPTIIVQDLFVVICRHGDFSKFLLYMVIYVYLTTSIIYAVL